MNKLEYIKLCPMCGVEKRPDNHGKNMRGDDICLVCGSIFEEHASDHENKIKNTEKKLDIIRAKDTKRLAKFVGGDFLNTKIVNRSRVNEKLLWILVWVLGIIIVMIIISIFTFIVWR